MDGSKISIFFFRYNNIFTADRGNGFSKTPLYCEVAGRRKIFLLVIQYKFLYVEHVQLTVRTYIYFCKSKSIMAGHVFIMMAGKLSNFRVNCDKVLFIILGSKSTTTKNG